MAEDKRTKMGTGPVPAQRGPLPADAPQPSTSYLPPQVDPLLGKTLAGRYGIVRKLGEGGMGSVYLATHNVLEKQIALKVLHGEFARKPDLVERFMQEAKAASRIRHENVIDISDFGTTPEGLVFFAMELLQGHDLHEEIARARLAGELLPWERSKKIFLQICSALSAAHAKGIIHRDLKPENVYLVEFLGDPDFVKLLDFGIAKLTEVSEGDRKLTRTGMLFGTPEYMSPEQARGEHVDHRVDIYAMGCILFQLVTGRVPFEADNFMGVLSLHLTEAPPQIALETFDRIGAPRALAGVIERALEKDKAARFQTIDELANAVRTVCGDPIPSGSAHAPKQRPPSVPAPAHTTNKVAVPAPTPAPGTGPRVRTQWTGSLSVPTDDAEPPAPARSKVPLVIGAAVVVAAGAAVAFVLATRESGAREPSDPPGSAAIATSGSGSQVASVTPDAAPSPPPPPEKAMIRLDSKPRGAQIVDLANNVVIGKTPLSFKVTGSHAPRQFGLRLKNHEDAFVEIVPDRDEIEHVETLVRGQSGSGTITRRIAGSAAGSGVGSAPKDPGSAARPPDPTPGSGSGAVIIKAPVDPGCTDDDDLTPCLKEFGSAGGGN